MKQRNHTNKKEDGSEVSSEVSQEVAQQATFKEESDKVPKVLIVYFSLTGNTNRAATIMKDFTQGDVFKIEPNFDYFQVKSRTEMEELGRKQVEEGFQPEGLF